MNLYLQESQGGAMRNVSDTKHLQTSLCVCWRGELLRG